MVDFCFGCKHSRAQCTQGPNGRMLISCSAATRPDGVLQHSEKAEPPWTVEEKYKGCALAEAMKFNGPFAEQWKAACYAKAEMSQKLDDAGKIFFFRE